MLWWEVNREQLLGFDLTPKVMGIIQKVLPPILLIFLWNMMKFDFCYNEAMMHRMCWILLIICYFHIIKIFIKIENCNVLKFGQKMWRFFTWGHVINWLNFELDRKPFWHWCLSRIPLNVSCRHNFIYEIIICLEDIKRVKMTPQ